jgi:hypothetical protein
MDSGMVVLQPLDEILQAIDKLGYFFTANYELLDWEASAEACRGCGVTETFRNGKLTLPATLMGFKKSGVTLDILKEALAVALVEKNIAATEITHRHDQAIISLLAYKHLKNVVIADGTLYLGSLLGSASPEQVPGQKIWAHRRKLGRADLEHFVAHIASPGKPYLPSAPVPLRIARAMSLLYKVHWHFGQGNLAQARDNLATAYAIAPELKGDPTLLARTLSNHAKKLSGLSGNADRGNAFVDWVLAQVKTINSEAFTNAVAASLEAIRAHR